VAAAAPRTTRARPGRRELRRQITDDPDIDEATRGALLAQLADPDDDDTSAELEDTADQVEEGKASAPAAAAGNGASPTS
jgi:hypothetical protein